MNYLIYSNATSTTGRELLAKLKEEGCQLEGGMNEPKTKLDTLIRWGATKLVGKPTKVLNTAKAIGLASNKLEALRTLKDNDIRVPKVFMPSGTIEFPVLGRKVHHIGGNDIVLCLQKKDIPEAQRLGCTYFTQYIPKTREYRVHVYEGQVIKTSEKKLTDPKLCKDPWIWNYDEGYTYMSVKEKPVPTVRASAIAAVECLGLTFGAVDVIVGDDNKAYVLEVNTAPGLQTDTSLAAYIEKFKVALG